MDRYNILHPTDFSPCAEQARQLAWTLARNAGAKLIVMHVSPPPTDSFDEIVKGISGCGCKERLWKRLQTLDWPDASVSVDLRQAEGEPVEAILRAAADDDCRLVVMGSRGRSNVKRHALGEVAEQILSRSNRPVITVSLAQPAGQHEQQRAPRWMEFPFHLEPNLFSQQPDHELATRTSN